MDSPFFLQKTTKNTLAGLINNLYYNTLEIYILRLTLVGILEMIYQNTVIIKFLTAILWKNKTKLLLPKKFKIYHVSLVYKKVRCV